jgi:hypothetical protein
MKKTFGPAIPVLMLLLATPWPGDAQCSNSDFKGVYSATVLGDFILPPPGVPAGPTARVGRVQVDGNGNSLITTTLSLDGIILQESYGGTYTIATDCVASVTLQIPFPGAPGPVPFHFTGMLAQQGRVMEIILVDPQGTDIRIVLQKQTRINCTSGDLKGDYSLNMTGTVIGSGLFARIGKATFDGAGKFTAGVDESQAGLVLTKTLSGAYTMDPNCSFTTTLTGSIDGSWFGVLADTGPSANLIVSTAGVVITGTLTSAQAPRSRRLAIR